MKKNALKIMTIFGTRPEIIRLSCVFEKMDRYLNQIMVHTGQSYDYKMNQIFFKELNIRKPDYFLSVKSKTLGGQIAKIIERTEKVIQKEKPDAVLILGDTNSSLSSICAKRMKIPIFHIEAGNRCFDENVPEEINRKIVDHISDVNMTYSENARLYLIREGISPNKIYVVGSPMAEIFKKNEGKIENSKVLKNLHLLPKKFFVASIHREENISNQNSLKRIIDALSLISDTYKLPMILSAHPRTNKLLEQFKFRRSNLLKISPPFGYFDYIKLQKNSLCVLSDSGTIVEEASILRFPAVQVRNSSERPEGYDEGSIILSGLDKDIILKSTEIAIDQFLMGEKFNCPKNYQDINFSSKVLRLVTGLTNTIRKNTDTQ